MRSALNMDEQLGIDDGMLLARVLVEESACGSLEEALMIVQAMMQDLNDGGGQQAVVDSNNDARLEERPPHRAQFDSTLLQDFLGVSPIVATAILERYAERLSCWRQKPNHLHESISSSNSDAVDSALDDDEMAELVRVMSTTTTTTVFMENVQMMRRHLACAVQKREDLQNEKIFCFTVSHYTLHTAHSQHTT